MDNRALVVIFIVLVLAGVFLFLWQRRDRGEEPVDRLPEALHEALDGLSGPPAVPPPEADHGGADGAAATIADRPLVIQPGPGGPPDDLTRMKGVGPKLATLLGELGVTHYAQIAGWSDDDIVAIDQHLGAFQGRIVRDRWAEQAGYLMRGDTAGFEAQFGKLGD